MPRPDVRDLIRRISRANPTWGSPRIVGELSKLGIVVAKSTVEKYRIRTQGSPSPTWKAFLANHLQELVAIDFFVVPTVKFKVLFVLVVLAHHRRRIVHFNATANPTAEWTAQQIVEAFPSTPPPGTSSVIATASTVRDSDGVWATSGSRKCSSRRATWH